MRLFIFQSGGGTAETGPHLEGRFCAHANASEACDHVDPDRAQRLVEEMKAKGLFPEKSKMKKKNRTDIPLDLDDP